MTASRRLFASLMIAGLLLAACTRETDTQTASEGAKAAVDDFWRAISTQDLDLLSRVIARDEEMVIFGTDAAERWVGSSAFLSAEAQLMQAFDVESLNRQADTLHVDSRGDVAWFSTVFDLNINVDGETALLTGLRTTGVLEKRSGHWVIVQAHTSTPVAGQQIEY